MTSNAGMLPTEKKVLRDARTGAPIWQLTDTPCINHAPYFLNPAWAASTPGGARDLLIVTSYRAGGPDLYGIRVPEGTLLRFTHTGDVSPWSACVSADGRSAFFTAGAQLRAVDVGTLESCVIGHVPPSSWLGNCSVSPDGSEIVTTARRGEKNALLAFRTDGSGERCVYETTELLAHAQWSPDGTTLLFASELPRMWLVGADGSDPHPLRAQTRQEWLVHEAWLSNDEIIFVHWPRALKSIRRDGSGERTIAAFNCWHPSPRRDGGLIVCDTARPDIGLQLIDPTTGDRRTLCHPNASSRGYQWEKPEPVWGGGAPDDAYGPQSTHPHPSFSPDGRSVVYTSDATGHPQVYLAFVEDERSD